MIEAGFIDQPQSANGLKEAQRAKCVCIGGIFRRLETHLHMALCRQIINFIRFNLLDQPHDIAAIGHVAIMHKEIDIFFMRVGVNAVNPLRVERRGAAFHAMHFITFGK